MTVRTTIELDNYQLAAAQHMDGRATVEAGAGSGKTRVVVHRVANLVEQGVTPSKILCLTFSNSAEDEMRDRILKWAGIQFVAVKTFHGMGLRIVSDEREMRYGQVIDGREAARILRRMLPRQIETKRARGYIAKKRRQMVSPQLALESATSDDHRVMAAAYDEYDKHLRSQGKIDFDAMIYWAVEILEGDEAARERWQKKFLHIMVDETHDCAFSDGRLAELLAGPENNLYFVGDKNQSIYGFRGGNAGILNQPNGIRYFLPLNYRSGQKIVDAFLPLAEPGRLRDEMQSVNGSIGSVKFWSGFTDEDSEVGIISKDIAGKISDGAFSKDFAILARTNAQLSAFADRLSDLSIPFRWRGKSFWQRPEVLDTLAFLELVRNPKNERALVRAVKSSAEVAKYLGEKFARAVVQTAGRLEVSFFDVEDPDGEWLDYHRRQWAAFRSLMESAQDWKEQSIETQILWMLEHSGLYRLSDNPEEGDSFVQENLDALCRRGVGFASLGDFLDRARRMRQLSQQKKGVTLSTIHSAKGREWPQVYVAGVSKDLLPHKRAQDEEEEKRILLVGMSRAMRFLSVSWHGEMSPLLELVNGKA